MNQLIISVGSNSPDREWQMTHAEKHLKQLLKKVVSSEIYEVPAYNGVDAPYLNMVMLAATNMEYSEVESAFKQWEIVCGRTPASKLQGVIPIDIDIVTWNGKVIKPVDYSREYVVKGVDMLLGRLL